MFRATVVAALASCVLGLANAQTPVGTSLTYQGELRSSGQPAAGPVDLRFKLLGAESLGVQIGPTIERLSVALTQGRFTQDLDFGSGAFGGETRWPEVEVRSPAGSGAFVTLVPRQRITAAPVAQFALSGNPGDAWVRLRGAPVEVDKTDLEKGTYQHPELYGQPAERGVNHDAKRRVDHPARVTGPTAADETKE